MEGTQYVTKESILRRAQEIKGIPLRDVDKTGRLATGKGAIGTVIEESWFGYTPNSESEPDFPEAGVELKVTPYLRGKNGIRAKERLVCNIINYMEEYDKTFQTSAFWHKCNTMLLMSYEHLADKPKGDFRIDEAVLFSFPEEDLAIIEHDWKTIMRETWEESELYNYLAPTKFMFVIFQERGDGEYTFDRVMFWNIPNDDLEEVHRVWARTVQTIREGVQLIQTPRGVSNNLPKQAESPVAHVRPHGKDASDKLPLPDGRMMTKQCFWLNNTYIAEQINR